MGCRRLGRGGRGGRGVDVCGGRTFEIGRQVVVVRRRAGRAGFFSPPSRLQAAGGGCVGGLSAAWSWWSWYWCLWWSDIRDWAVGGCGPLAGWSGGRLLTSISAAGGRRRMRGWAVGGLVTVVVVAVVLVSVVVGHSRLGFERAPINFHALRKASINSTL